MSFVSLGQARIGVAATTLVTNTAAAKIHRAFRKRRGLHVILDDHEIEEENLQHYMTVMCNLMAITPIQAYNAFDDDINPTNQENRRCVSTSTCLQYIGQWFKNLHANYPHHNDFINLANDEYPL